MIWGVECKVWDIGCNIPPGLAQVVGAAGGSKQGVGLEALPRRARTIWILNNSGSDQMVIVSLNWQASVSTRHSMLTLPGSLSDLRVRPI